MSAKCVQTGLFTKFTDRLIGPLLSASNHRQIVSDVSVERWSSLSPQITLLSLKTMIYKSLNPVGIFFSQSYEIQFEAVLAAMSRQKFSNKYFYTCCLFVDIIFGKNRQKKKLVDLLLFVIFRATVPRANHVMMSVCDSFDSLWGSKQWYFLPPR